MNATEYRKYHESYMQNNHGSTAFHTFCCILLTVQSSIFVSIRPISTSNQYIYEYVVIVMPMILAHTALAEYIYILNFVIFILLFHKLMLHKNNLKNFYTNNVFKDNRIPLISSLRGLTYLITVFAILAVDFRYFPRYLAKTERFGYSLMDTGVGLFVAMSGLVHKDLHNNNIKTVVKGNIKLVLILIFLGIARFVSVKQLDYQEHITEYGVHWNFFFTIAVCKIISTVLLYISNHALLLSILTLVLHESVLYIGLQNWVFSDEKRDSIITANREGLSSCLGYVSIYLFSVCIKHVLLNRNATKYDTLKNLCYGSIVLWILTYWNVVSPTSRTLANAGYCLFINVILISITSIMYFVMVLCEDKYQTPLITYAINTNGLSYFLIANLLTGAINLTVRTLLLSYTATFIILNIYMTVTQLIVVYLKSLDFRI